MANLKGLKVAILVEDGFEQVELAEPRKALGEAGAETHIVSPKPDTVRGWNFTGWGDEFPVDVNLDQALPAGFDIPVFNREMTGLFGRTRAKARQTA